MTPTPATLRLLLLGPLCLAIVLAAGCSAFRSDKDQVRDAIQAHFDSYATIAPSRSTETLEKNSCAALAAKIRKSFEEEGVFDEPDDGTTFTMTVDAISNIQVADDSATASVILHSSSKPDPRSFVATAIKEDGAWKYCTV